MVLAHAFLALLESRRSLSVELRRCFSIHSKSTLIQADGVEIYGLTVRRPRKSAIAPRPLRMQKIQTECSGTIFEERGGFASLSFLVFEVVWSQCACSVTLRQSLVARRYSSHHLPRNLPFQLPETTISNRALLRDCH